MIKGTNKYEKLGELLQGIYTLETLADRLKVDKIKATYIIHRLRKLGLVKTSYVSGRKRLYNISLKNKQKGISLVDIINKVSHSASYAIVTPEDNYYVYGRIPSYEETLIHAIKQRDVRYLIASLILFRKITNWSLLYKLAKKENLVKEIAALYEVARRTIRKVRRIPKRFLHLAQKNKTKKFSYIINHLSSDDYKDIEKKWKVHIPLNHEDLEEYTK